jgi:hypothetical protein
VPKPCHNVRVSSTDCTSRNSDCTCESRLCGTFDLVECPIGGKMGEEGKEAGYICGT